MAATSWSPSPAAATPRSSSPSRPSAWWSDEPFRASSTPTALAEVRDLLPPDVGATAELDAYREAWKLDAEGPAADLATRLGAALGTGPTFDAPYWMEAPLWQAVCPTLVCGPSGGGLHAADEWVDLRQVRALAEALPGVLRAWADARRAD